MRPLRSSCWPIAAVVRSRFNCQTAPLRPAGYAGHGPRVSRRRASSPRGLSGSRARRSSLRPFPRRSVRNDRAKSRARGARMVWMRASRMPSVAHGQWPSPTPKIVELNRASEADLRLRSARGWIFRLAACPRGCHWRRRAPVRASCRPDMHLGRPPVAPASAPSAARIRNPRTCPGPGIVAATASRCHVSKTIATRPSPERDGGDDIGPTATVKNKIRTSTNYFF